MDRLLREGNPPVGQLASPKPQYKKPGVDEYAPVEGQHGAPFATLKDATGAVVSPATEAKLEQVRELLSGVATENKLEQARTLLDAINTKDFATSSKQDALNTVVEDLKSELALVKEELQAIKANQLSGNQKVSLSGTIGSQIITVNASFVSLDTTAETLVNVDKPAIIDTLTWGVPSNWLVGTSDHIPFPMVVPFPQVISYENRFSNLFTSVNPAPGRLFPRPATIADGGSPYFEILSYNSTIGAVFSLKKPIYLPQGFRFGFSAAGMLATPYQVSYHIVYREVR